MAKAATKTRKAGKTKAQVAPADAGQAVEPSIQTGGGAKPDDAAASSGGPAAADHEIPAAGGAEGSTEGAAAPTGDPEAKALDREETSDAADPAGTAAAPAAAAEESRQQGEGASADRKDASEQGIQPEATAEPPVAGQASVLIVRGPKEGFRRVGYAFGPEPTELPEGEFDGDDGAARFVAIITEPRLRCMIRDLHGVEAPVDPELIEAAKRAMERLSSEAAQA